jgi:hypothetical protein
VRPAAEADLEAILVLTTLGAPERRRWRDRKGREVQSADAEPVPTARVTIVKPEPLGSLEERHAWLAGVRESGGQAELDDAFALLNQALHAWRAASGDPYTGDVAPWRLLVARIGFGEGESVADGRFAEAWEVPPAGSRRARRSMEAPEERFAAILGGRDIPLAAEDLVLRARADLDAGRTREAALQSRVALEALLAELGAGATGGLDAHRPAVAEAANRALEGAVPERAEEELRTAVERMEAICRGIRVGVSNA